MCAIYWTDVVLFFHYLYSEIGIYFIPWKVFFFLQHIPDNYFSFFSKSLSVDFIFFFSSKVNPNSFIEPSIIPPKVVTYHLPNIWSTISSGNPDFSNKFLNRWLKFLFLSGIASSYLVVGPFCFNSGYFIISAIMFSIYISKCFCLQTSYNAIKTQIIINCDCFF